MSWLNILSVGPCWAHHIVSFNSCFLSLLDLVYLDCIRIDWTHERVVYGATSFVHDLHFHCFSLLFLTDGGVLLLWVELFEISFMIARWEPQWFLLYRLRLTTTGINWQRLHIFTGIETGNASPAQWLTDTGLSQKGWTNVHSAVTQMSASG